MANKKYKILVPKPCAIDEHGMDVQLMKADSIVEADNDVMNSNMEQFVQNGWAMEVKVDSADESVEVEPSGAVGMILSIITVPLLRGVDE